jgi:hypothetical protein
MAKTSFQSIIKLPLNAVTDIKFEKSLGLDISRVFYVLSLASIAISAIVSIVWGFILGLALIFNTTVEYDYYNDEYTDVLNTNPFGFLIIIGTIVVVPLATVFSVLLVRWAYEIYNAFIQTAQNTKK